MKFATLCATVLGASLALAGAIPPPPPAQAMPPPHFSAVATPSRAPEVAASRPTPGTPFLPPKGATPRLGPATLTFVHRSVDIIPTMVPPTPVASPPALVRDAVGVDRRPSHGHAPRPAHGHPRRRPPHTTRHHSLAIGEREEDVAEDADVEDVEDVGPDDDDDDDEPDEPAPDF